MKIQSILEKAKAANTIAEVKTLYDEVRAELDSHNKYKGLEGKANMCRNNNKSYLDERNLPHMSFNFVEYLSAVFSTHHAVEIVFEVRHGGFVGHVNLIYFKDGLGRNSRDYERIRKECIDFTTNKFATVQTAFEEVAAVADSWNVSINFEPSNKVASDINA